MVCRPPARSFDDDFERRVWRRISGSLAVYIFSGVEILALGWGRRWLVEETKRPYRLADIFLFYSLLFRCKRYEGKFPMIPCSASLELNASCDEY